MHVGLVLKATRNCNLRCHYCHDWRSGSEYDMSFETVARVTAAVLQHPQVRSVQFTWHGGEPTLRSIDFYKRALYVQSILSRNGQICRNNIQTNATRLNTDWCQFLSENEFNVGVSIDGPRSLHDLQRPFASGRGSEKEVLRGFQMLRDWGIKPGVLMVIDHEAIKLGPRAMLDFMLSLDIKNIGLNFAVPDNDPMFSKRSRALPLLPAAHYINQSDTTAFLLGLFEECKKNPDTNIEIRELEALRCNIEGQKPILCTLAGKCLGKRFLIEPNGDFAHCDLFVGDSAYTLGNVYKSDFSGILESKVLTKLQRIESAKQSKLSTCKFYKICNGGCPHERYIAVRYDPEYREDCCGQYELISGLLERMAQNG